MFSGILFEYPHAFSWSCMLNYSGIYVSVLLRSVSVLFVTKFSAGELGPGQTQDGVTYFRLR
jgi:hypothetical protein